MAPPTGPDVATAVVLVVVEVATLLATTSGCWTLAAAGRVGGGRPELTAPGSEK